MDINETRNLIVNWHAASKILLGLNLTVARTLRKPIAFPKRDGRTIVKTKLSKQDVEEFEKRESQISDGVREQLQAIEAFVRALVREFSPTIDDRLAVAYCKLRDVSVDFRNEARFASEILYRVSWGMIDWALEMLAIREGISLQSNSKNYQRSLDEKSAECPFTDEISTALTDRLYLEKSQMLSDLENVGVKTEASAHVPNWQSNTPSNWSTYLGEGVRKINRWFNKGEPFIRQTKRKNKIVYAKYDIDLEDVFIKTLLEKKDRKKNS